MIQFFRKIRFGLVGKNNTAKYLKYAIGEIVLVVIGIMIALQANNWNQSRKQLNNEVQLYSDLYFDLNTEYIDIETDARRFGSYSKLYSNVYSQTIGEAEYDPDLNYDFLLWLHRYNMYINEKYSESFTALTNDKIHERFKYFIEVEKHTNDAISEWNEHQVKEVRPFLGKQGIYRTKAMFNAELDGFASIINETELIEYSKLKEQYGSLEFDQLLFTIQFKTTWALQNLVWLNESNLIFQAVLKEELERYGETENIAYWEKEKLKNRLRSEADTFYETEEYHKSASKYEELFMLLELVPEDDRYNAACSFALAEDIESAFIQLFIIANAPYKFKDHHWMIKDTDLDILHKDERWNELIAIVKLNLEEG